MVHVSLEWPVGVKEPIVAELVALVGIGEDDADSAVDLVAAHLVAAIGAGTLNVAPGRPGDPTPADEPPLDFEALVAVLDPHLDAPDMAAWERRDRTSKAEFTARRLVAAGYRLAADPAESSSRFTVADRFGGRPARGVTP